MAGEDLPDRLGAAASQRVDTATRQRLRAAAAVAVERHPGAIGELLRQELLSWMVFGLHLGDTLIQRVADDLLDDTEAPPERPTRSEPAASRGPHQSPHGRHTP